MKIILFGATGMVGQGVLHECLRDDGVERVLTIVRSPTGQTHAKLRELVHADLFDLAPVEAELAGYDACFFCLGVSAAGMSEAEYRRVTYDLTLAVAERLARLDRAMTFIYVSGAGTDENARAMWARVKGQTESALQKLPFKATYLFRPGLIRPMHGARSKTRIYRVSYALLTPLFPLLALSPSLMTTSEKVGRAMLAVARHGAPQAVLDNREINALATER